MRKRNLLMVHGGGPTAVLNASLYGSVAEALKRSDTGEILAAAGGMGGLLQGRFINMREVAEDVLARLPFTPGSAIGTSRDPLTRKEYDAMAALLRERQIDCVLCTGGNGTMDACGKLADACRNANCDVRVIGVPKTIDNDIAVTDHSPGYASAARYIAHSVQEVCADVKGLPIHVSVVETLGRNAGWIAAASALAARGGAGPDLIYLPERPFCEQEFLDDVAALLRQKSGIVVVCSEGLADAKGNPIVPPTLQVGRATYFGDVSAYLAKRVQETLGYKARSEKPGLLGRASIALQSSVDRAEAEEIGRVACRAVLEGETGKMVALRRVQGATYRAETFLTDIQNVMLGERRMPDAFINGRGNGVTNRFLEWCEPLLGAPLPAMTFFS